MMPSCRSLGWICAALSRAVFVPPVSSVVSKGSFLKQRLEIEPSKSSVPLFFLWNSFQALNMLTCRMFCCCITLDGVAIVKLLNQFYSQWQDFSKTWVMSSLQGTALDTIYLLLCSTTTSIEPLGNKKKHKKTNWEWLWGLKLELGLAYVFAGTGIWFTGTENYKWNIRIRLGFG